MDYEDIAFDIVEQLYKLETSKTKRGGQLRTYLRKGHGERVDLAYSILDNTIAGMNKRETLVCIGEKVGMFFMKQMGFTQSEMGFNGDYKLKTKLMKVGVEAVGILSLLGHVKLAKAIKMKGKNEMNTIEPLSDVFMKLAIESEKSMGLFPSEEYEPWVKPWKGQYSIVKKMPVGWDDKYMPDVIPEVYKALNYYGSTPFGINKWLLETAGVMSGEEHPWCPTKMDDSYVTEILHELVRTKQKEDFVKGKKAEWALSVGIHGDFLDKLSKQMAKDWYTEKSEPYIKVISEHSKRVEFDMVMRKAGALDHTKAFYFDYQLDSRGRFYPMQQWLEPTGSDLSKACLQFFNPTPWSPDVELSLAYHIANCAGKDKLSKEERIAWTYSNYEDIKVAVRDPNNSPLVKAIQDEKKTRWQFLASAKSFVDLVESDEPENWGCHIPIGLDATNSGLQILSALVRDRKGCEDTNVIQHPSRDIGDAYEEVWDVSKTKMYALAEGTDNTGLSERLKAYIDNGSRKVTKRPTMSYYYSAGEECIRYQLYNDRSSFGSRVFSDMRYKDTKELASCIYGALDGEAGAYPSQARILKTFQEGAKNRIKKSDDVYISWKTPTGFTAFQGYGKIHTKRINVKFGKAKKDVTVAYGFDGPLSSRHRTGISANIVHSLDASLMTKTLSCLGDVGVKDFMMIHDQFSVPANHVDLLFEEFKGVFVETMSENLLASILGDIGHSDSDIQYGDVKDSEILNSNYIIS
jgi:DNA-directed RNA polymerase